MITPNSEQLKKLVPITIITSQSRSVETDHQPRIAGSRPSTWCNFRV
jgi:hypothetical protein